jgi:hypothetical protein
VSKSKGKRKVFSDSEDSEVTRLIPNTLSKWKKKPQPYIKGTIFDITNNSEESIQVTC